MAPDLSFFFYDILDAKLGAADTVLGFDVSPRGAQRFRNALVSKMKTNFYSGIWYFIELIISYSSDSRSSRGSPEIGRSGNLDEPDRPCRRVVTLSHKAKPFIGLLFTGQRIDTPTLCRYRVYTNAHLIDIYNRSESCRCASLSVIIHLLYSIIMRCPVRYRILACSCHILSSQWLARRAESPTFMSDCRRNRTTYIANKIRIYGQLSI